MSQDFYICSTCSLVGIQPQHECKEGKPGHATIVLRICSVCGAPLPAGKVFHDWCAKSHRAELAAARQDIIDRCNKTGDDIDRLIDIIPDIAPWQRVILRQLVEAWHGGKKVKLATNSRRNGQMTLKKHWSRIEKLLEEQAKEKK